MYPNSIDTSQKFSSGTMWKYAGTSDQGLSIRKAYEHHLSRKADKEAEEKREAAERRLMRQEDGRRTQAQRKSHASGQKKQKKKQDKAKQDKEKEDEHYIPREDTETDRRYVPQLEVGEKKIDKGDVAVLLAEEEWAEKVACAASQVVYKAAGAWYIGENMSESGQKLAIERDDGVTVTLSKRQLPIGKYSGPWFLIAR